MRRILAAIFPSLKKICQVVENQELTAMKNPYEVLYRKEEDLARVRQEIESLKIVASLLGQEDLSFFPPDQEPEAESKKAAESVTSPAELATTGTHPKAATAGSTGFWGSLKRRRS
jgi:hypothetical protein